MDVEVKILDESDAYEKVRSGLVLTHAVNTKKIELDETEQKKGAGFPLVRSLANYVAHELNVKHAHLSSEDKKLKWKHMVSTILSSSEDALLNSLYDKTEENWTEGKGWNTRKLLGSTWASAKSVVFSAIDNEVDFWKDSSGKFLGKSAIEAEIKKKKAAARKAVPSIPAKEQKLTQVVENLEYLCSQAANEDEKDDLEKALDIVLYVKNGGS